MTTLSWRRSPRLGLQCRRIRNAKSSLVGQRAFGTAAHREPRPSVRVIRPVIESLPIQPGRETIQKGPEARITPGKPRNQIVELARMQGAASPEHEAADAICLGFLLQFAVGAVKPRDHCQRRAGVVLERKAAPASSFGE
ncbi:hypothetical protein [Methylobacterium oryzihabitans]|uniref:Uncharacterized protein n=1 Tax=Methylobacterium oryzihabitans TaxID=2499852 RepID=A0A437P802_9HYPH|nr:hypothetical protein [Methylobacterium oryzihabitans]RVU18402.1 hypothetical protein EOE48_10930 [Methylobacterium oryzihabitans]